MTKTTTINVPIITRVEGEGALHLQITQQQITELQLRIYEPPRLFEKFLEGRSYAEVLDFVARICGICPVAYQMSAVHAIEAIFAIQSEAPEFYWIREMRRLFYCGEWLESHSIHIHFLAVPDFFGYKSAIEMAKDYPDEIRRGMRLQTVGHELIKLFGARAVHPVGACVGGFFHAPSLNQINSVLKNLEARLDDAQALLRWLATFPQYEKYDNSQEFVCVSLHHPEEYPFSEGRIVSDAGLDIGIDVFEQHFHEAQVPYSNALHCTLNDRSYLVGPLARINLNYDRLPKKIREFVEELGFVFPSRNMFHSVVARAIEIYYCLTEAIRILKNYHYPKQSALEVVPRAGVGFGCTEAPRGLLWHRYELDEQGMVKSARIVPPTSQNQKRIEEDLYFSLNKFGLNHADEKLRAYSEMIIRNYDPCISCSTHFLDLRVERL